tara:strand:- start:787 stop:993 length:207 start_codon:yes stop_codon:yes gene_type:complete
MPKRENLSKPLSLRLSPIVRKTIKDLSEDTGLLQAQLYDMVLKAGCLALVENKGSFELPLKFEVVKRK